MMAMNKKRIIYGVCVASLAVLINFGCSADEEIFHIPEKEIYISCYQPWFDGCSYLVFSKKEAGNPQDDCIRIRSGMNKSLTVHFDQETEDVVFNSSLTDHIVRKGFSRKPDGEDVVYLQGCPQDIDVIKDSSFKFMVFNPGILPFRFPEYFSDMAFPSDAFHKKPFTLYSYVSYGCIEKMIPQKSGKVSLFKWKIFRHQLLQNNN